MLLSPKVYVVATCLAAFVALTWLRSAPQAEACGYMLRRICSFIEDLIKKEL
jgi:hypothetical protein